MMIRLKILLLLPLALAFLPWQLAAQTCSAAFLNGTMLVERYTPGAQVFISQESQGILTVNEVTLDERGGTAQADVPFQVAIRNSKTNTLSLWTAERVRQVDIAQVLAGCSKGDAIVLIIPAGKWALPHHELLVR